MAPANKAPMQQPKEATAVEELNKAQTSSTLQFPQDSDSLSRACILIDCLELELQKMLNSPTLVGPIRQACWAASMGMPGNVKDWKPLKAFKELMKSAVELQQKAITDAAAKAARKGKP